MTQFVKYRKVKQDTRDLKKDIRKTNLYCIFSRLKTKNFKGRNWHYNLT